MCEYVIFVLTFDFIIICRSIWTYIHTVFPRYKFSCVRSQMSEVLPNPHGNNVKFSRIRSSWVKSFPTSEIEFVWTFIQKFPLIHLEVLTDIICFLIVKLYFSQTTSSLQHDLSTHFWFHDVLFTFKHSL